MQDLLRGQSRLRRVIGRFSARDSIHTRQRTYHINQLTGSRTVETLWRATVNLNDKHQIILNAFRSSRYGVSPTATRGAVESHARKHKLEGQDYVDALDSAMAAGLVAQMADSALTIRNAGRKLLPK